jgi:hypothetical protein
VPFAAPLNAGVRRTDAMTARITTMQKGTYSIFLILALLGSVNSASSQSKPKLHPKIVRCPDEVSTTGRYRNYSYGFSITIPASLKGYWNSARCVKERNDCVCMGDHGRHIPIRNDAHLDIFVGPRNYDTRKDTIDDEQEIRLKVHKDKGESAEILSRITTRLDGFPATRLKLGYNGSKTGAKMIEESIICAPMDREHGGFVYTIYLVTREDSYTKDRLLLNRLQQTWKFRSIP